MTTTGAYEPEERYHCKITVLRKDFNRDLYDQHPYGLPEPCGRFEVGQQFMTENPWDPPTDFRCPWAWADLRTAIHRIHAGNPTTMVYCCTDGHRPVFFSCEAVEITQTGTEYFKGPDVSGWERPVSE